MTYVIAAGCWILFSDELVKFLIRNPDARVELSIFKGLGFVILTGGMLYFSLRRLLGRWVSEAGQRARAEMIARAALEKLRVGEDQLRIVMDTSQDGWWDLNCETGLAELSPRYWAMVGYKPGEVVTDMAFFQRLVHPDDWALVAAARDAHVAGKSPQNASEFRMFSKDGAVKWVLARSRVVARAADGRPLRMVGTVSDITERKLAEQKLHDSEQRYRKLFDLESDALFLGDCATHQILDANQAARQLYGYTREEFWQLKLEDVSAEPDTSRVSVDADEGQISLRWHRRKSGEHFPVEITTSEFESGGRRLKLGAARDITARRQAEAALRDSEERYRQIFAVESDAILVVDRESRRFIDVNPAAERMYGYSREEFLQMLATDVSAEPEKTLGNLESEIAPAVLLLHRRKDGTIFPVEVSDSTFEYQGRMIKVGAMRDITERKQVELTLRASEEKFRQLAEHITDVFWICSLDFRIMHYVSPGYETIWGRSTESLYSDPYQWVEAILPEERERVFAAFTALAGGETGLDIEYRIARPDGTVRWIHDRGFQVRDVAGKVIRRAGIASDITERKEAERRMVDAVNYAQTLLAASPIGIITYRASGETVSANAAAARLVGTTVENLQQQNFRELDSWKKSNLLKLADTALETGHEQLFEDHTTSSYGVALWLLCRFVPFRFEGSPHLLLMAQDISERKQLEDHLRQAQKMEAIGQLAGGVAHDFNNILAATLMHLGLLQQDPELTLGTKAVLKEVEDETMRAANLTRQLLLFSRRQVAKVETLDLNGLISALLKMLGRLLGENIAIKFQSPSHAAWVSADAGMLEQVVMNLCINARDAMPKGGCLTLTTAMVEFGNQPAGSNPDARSGRFVCLSVTDTGCGMNATVLKRIFEPFFTTKEVGKGTGLGLATVYGIVKQHEGWVEVESVVDQGSSFRVYLPAREKHPESSRSFRDSEAIKGGSETILLVEDDISLRRVAALCLRKLGYAVLEASNGEDALKLWAQHHQKIALLLTDEVMPGTISGSDLTNRLKAEKASLRTIISSGFSAKLKEIPSANGTEIAYLAKPYQAAALAKIVRLCLDKPEWRSGN